MKVIPVIRHIVGTEKNNEAFICLSSHSIFGHAVHITRGTSPDLELLMDSQIITGKITEGVFLLKDANLFCKANT
jgi:hypothetical protein